MSDLLPRFERHLDDSGLIPKASRVLVGYSGGADSTCLLHMMSQLGFDVVAGHLHHGQRAEADEEMASCDAFCRHIDVPFLSGQADVPRMANDLKVGLEEAGRQARYTFFNQAAYRTGCALVATAHTRSDLVETVLMNLARGAGLKGMAGIPEKRGNVVRPLLPFSREETQAYCEAHGLWTHDDPANTDHSFSRARVRHSVVPELRHLNEAFDANVARLAEIVREEDSFLDGMAAAALEQSEWPLNGGLSFLTEDVEVAFYRARLTQLPAPLFKRAIRLAVEALGAALDYHQTLEVTQKVSHEEKGSVTSEEGKTVVEWKGEQIHVRSLIPTTPFRFSLTVPGETISDEFGWQFVAHEGVAGKPQRVSMEVALDPSQLKGQLYFRTAKEGDAMKPLGFDGHRKLSDLLSEARLTSAARLRLPIVCDMVGPLWAPGVCLDGRAIAPDGSTNAVILRFEPLKLERGS